MNLPRMLDNNDFILSVAANEAEIESTAQTIVLGNLAITLVLSVSLKQMWNLLNVMQVVVYVFLFVRWPAMVTMCRDFIFEAITLQKLSGHIMDFGKSKFEVAKETTDDSFLASQGISDTSVAKSLGILTVILVLIILLVLLYYLISWCNKRWNCCSKLKSTLSKKLFFETPIRFAIQSYLQQCITMSAFLSIAIEQN